MRVQCLPLFKVIRGLQEKRGAQQTAKQPDKRVVCVHIILSSPYFFKQSRNQLLCIKYVPEMLLDNSLEMIFKFGSRVVWYYGRYRFYCGQCWRLHHQVHLKQNSIDQSSSIFLGVGGGTKPPPSVYCRLYEKKIRTKKI